MNTEGLLTVQQVNNRAPGILSPFVQHLLTMDPRVRLYEMVDDVADGKAYILTKTQICLPYQLPTIQHEIAHFVEMEDKSRWTKTDWGLGVRPNFLDTTTVPHLIAAAARESRVRAIQYKMNVESDPYLFANQFWQEAMERRAIGTGRFKSSKDITNWVWGMSIRAQSDWDLDRIESAWKERITHLQNWMET